MKGFVVDGNVVLNAVRGSNDSGEEALAEGEFLPRLLRVKITVFVNEAIAKKFRAMGGKIRAGSRPEDCNNSIYKGIAAMLRDGRMVTYVEAEKVEWEGLKKCDKEFVGVALRSGGTLVTSDTKLRRIAEEMQRQGLRIECIGADQALRMLGQNGGQEKGEGGGAYE